MPKMTEQELLSYVLSARTDAITVTDALLTENSESLRYYNGEPFGNEVEGESSVVSTDVFDVIESDMASLTRIFLGPHDILSFEPNTSSEEDVREAEEKTKYINWLVKNQKDSFKTMFDWLKESLIMKPGVVKFFVEEKKVVKEREYQGLDDDEVIQIVSSLEEDYEESKILESSVEDGKTTLKFRCTKTEKKIVIKNVPFENFRISPNSRSKDDAILVGDDSYKTRGQLISEGFDKETIKNIPLGTLSSESTMASIRFRSEGGDAHNSVAHWASEELAVSDYYMLIDFDGDGIPERRHIIIAGTEILENEPCDIVPYALLSAVPMPHTAIGKSRAEAAKPYQAVKSAVLRQTVTNIYRVNAARVVINDDETNIDDLSVIRPMGIVRTKGDPQTAVFPLVTEYIGDKSLQVIQYLDSARAQSTGSLLSNQGLDADSLYKETATRFAGIEDASMAKIELIARVFAETGIKDLYEGLAYIVSHYQDSETEIMVLGKPLTVNPKMWRFDHRISSGVGLAAGDDATTLANMGSLLTIQQQLATSGSVLTDEKKTYNTLSKVIKAMGISRVDEFINNPEVPEQTLMAQLQQAQQQLAQLQQQMNDPMLAIEQARSQGRLEVEQVKQDAETKRFMVDMEARQIELANKQEEFNRNMMARLTEMELASGQNVPGAVV